MVGAIRARAQPVARRDRPGGAGEASRYDTTPRVRDDGPIFVDTMVAPMFDDEQRQRVTHLVISGIDVTEKRRAEQALRESEERLSLAMRAAGLGTWDENVATGEALWSEQNFRLLGYQPPADGAATIEMWRRRVHPDDLARVTVAIETATRDRSLYNPEYRIVRDDGAIRWISATGRFIYDEAGRPVRFIGVMQDITAQSADEEIARLNRDLHRHVGELQALLEVIPVGIGIAHDAKCARIDVNAAFGACWGSPAAPTHRSAPPGERPDNFTCWSGNRQLRADELPLQVAARTGFVVRDIEIEVRHSEGRVTHLLEYAAPLLDSYGMTRGSVGAFIDISDRKKAEVERQALTDQANAERAKLEAVLRQMPSGVIIAEASAEAAWGRVVLCNEQFERIWRRSVNGHAAEPDRVSRRRPTIRAARVASVSKSGDGRARCRARRSRSSAATARAGTSA